MQVGYIYFLRYSCFEMVTYLETSEVSFNVGVHFILVTCNGVGSDFIHTPCPLIIPICLLTRL